ncbi:MAG TPA: alpha/beta fold hydrolase, partial [Candidatus Acidoferrum sp.]|nr:alpha/beta fold hydrolase [Candidatus Acidoferrum sp.]
EATTTDGVRLAGALWIPATPDWKRPALLLVHGYAGNFYEEWPPLAERLAARGFSALALNMRDHDRTPQTSRFEDNRLDIEAGIRLLAQRGATRIALLGQSLGTNRVLFYLAETQDPRVSDLILMAPPGNLLEWNIRTSGPERSLALLAEAEQRVREGRGGEVMLVDLGPLGKALYSADHIVSLRGPHSRSDPFQNIARVRVPILILHGTADRLAEPAVSLRLQAAATAAQSVQVHLIPGADHALPRRPSELLPILEPWLETVIK